MVDDPRRLVGRNDLVIAGDMRLDRLDGTLGRDAKKKLFIRLVFFFFLFFFFYTRS